MAAVDSDIVGLAADIEWRSAAGQGRLGWVPDECGPVVVPVGSQGLAVALALVEALDRAALSNEPTVTVDRGAVSVSFARGGEWPAPPVRPSEVLRIPAAVRAGARLGDNDGDGGQPRAAGQLARLGDDERRLLTSVERPIVLAPRRTPLRLAPEVAPRNPLVGLMLPYTPLHHLLLQRVRAPLVMTSGNLSEEPLAYENDEAVTRLGGIADLFVVRDRRIESPCDDSVTRVVAGVPTVLRRSRGFVPRPLKLARPVARPVLACGALLKNTFCLASGDDAWLGPHIGDLDNLATHEYFQASIARLERFLRITPEVVAHDLHPDYPSTAYAQSRPGVDVVGVQHHHAHVASALAEHGLSGPVIGIAYDGTGWGTDGSAWGGEILVADTRAFTRVATFRPLPLC